MTFREEVYVLSRRKTAQVAVFQHSVIKYLIKK